MKFKKVALATVMTYVAFFSALNYADDSEVFFNLKSKKIPPNILFLLDVSGSMYYPPGFDFTRCQLSNTCPITPPGASKMDMLKAAVKTIMEDTSIKDIRVGMMSFESGYRTDDRLHNPIADIDGIDPTKDKVIVSSNGSSTVFRQRILVGLDDADESNNYMTTGSNYVEGVNSSMLFGSRFDNVLLKNPRSPDVVASGGVSAPNYGINSAKLSINLSKKFTLNQGASPLFFNVYIDPAENSKRFIYGNNLSDRLPNADFIQCPIAQGNAGYRDCDVTPLIRAKIADGSWSDGNAITFLYKIGSVHGYVASLNISFKEYSSGFDEQYAARLTIDANTKIVAENKSTYRKAIIDETDALIPVGGTAIVGAMYDAARYITSMPGDGSYRPKGPAHSGKLSPLTEDCQATHLILMSDGAATDDDTANVMPYIDQPNGCTINGLSDMNKGTGNGEACGRALSYWMANTNQSNFPMGNYIRTQTVGFDIDDGSDAQLFLDDIAKYGGGISYNVNNTSELVEAFTKIIASALVVDNIPMNAQVTVSAQNKHNQRQEAFYSMFKSDSYNYWSGNMKGFLIKYDETTEVNTGETIRQPVLYDKTSSKIAMGVDGRIVEDASSFWSNQDGGSVALGGVVEQLPDDPQQRNLFTLYFSDEKYLLSSTASSSKVGNKQLAVTNDDRRKGLLDFIRGYTYKLGGSDEVAPKKIGDSARSKVQLVTYGCDTNKDLLNCKFEDLQQVALLASNDGFIRGYNVQTGEALYEYMHLDKLPLIQKLEQRTGVSAEVPRFYGLDGTITYYHDDINGNGYVDPYTKETLHAYAVSGRGGRTMYAMDITRMNNFKLAWKRSNESYGFEELGDTWSVPVVGKVMIDNVITPVIIFGAGYDKSNDTNPAQHTNSMGAALFIVDAKSGDLKLKISLAGYSVPSSIETVVDDNGYITDLFFGDTGGNLWRFKVNYNANNESSLLTPLGKNGIVASISGTTENQTRRFFQKPAVYKLRDDDDQEVFSVNIGTGDQAHPLAKNTSDRFYSFRFPVNQTQASGTIITESDLAKVQLNKGNSTLENEDNLSNGFMFVLEKGLSDRGTRIEIGTETPIGNKGEKIVSELAADFGRVVFNTFTPSPRTFGGNCEAYPGTQRTYAFNLKTGRSLLASGYLETGISGLPTDVAVYCDTGFCTFVTSLAQLSGEIKVKASEGATGDDRMPLIVKRPRAEKVIKTGWTDYFDAAPRPCH